MPSINVTRKLGGLEVSTEDGLVTVHEGGDPIDIYLPLVIPELRRVELNYELEDRFAKLLAIEDKHRRLSSLLMIAPLSQLSGILGRHDIPPPSAIGNEGNSESADTSDSENTISVYGTRQGSMNELIPSHRSRTQEISQMASTLNISDWVVARPSAEQQRVLAAEPSGGLSISLPIRTRGSQPAVSFGSNEQQGGTARGDSSHSPRPLTAIAAGGSTSWSQVSHPTIQSRERDRPLPAVELRYREIGFHGELLVSTNTHKPSLVRSNHFDLPGERSTSFSNAESAIGLFQTGPASCDLRPVIPDSPKRRKNSATLHTMILQGS